MTMRRGTNLPAVGEYNQAVVLDAIRRSPGLSRAELAHRTGLSSQSMSNVARRLLVDGLIREAKPEIRGRGKPRVPLELVANSRFAVGLHLDPAVVTYVILNLEGTVINSRHSPDVAGNEPAEAVTVIGNNINRLIDDVGIDRATILGLGIASPGPIDAVRGLVDPPLIRGWAGVPLRDGLSAATGLPATLEKDVNAAVVAELWTGGDDASKNFAFLYFGTGLGLGLYLSGEVFLGSSGNAGSAGTLVVSATDLPSRRISDHLGHLVTPEHLVGQAVDAGVLPAPPNGSGDLAWVDESFALLVELIETGDATALQIADRAARYIAAALVSVVNLLDIDRIVVGGPYWAPLSPRLLPQVSNLLNESPDRETRRPVEVKQYPRGEDVAAIGAACLVLNTRLSPRPSSLLIESS